MRFKLLLLTIAVLTISACTYTERPSTDHAEDNIIGSNLTAVSSLTAENGGDQQKIAMYDPVVCRIHQFDMGSGSWERTLKPAVLGGEHKILFDPSGNYVIDLVDANLTVFDKAGNIQNPELTFVGAPKNASFRPSLGYVVMQDDLKTAGLMKINAQGTVTGRQSLGQIIYNDVSILAGDIDDQGQLILALTDGNIAVIDIDQTIATHDWAIKYKFASGLNNINWLAPMHDGSSQVLVKTNPDTNQNVTIALFDTAAKAMVGAPYVVPATRKVVKTSKLYDPHFILKDDTDHVDAMATVVYVQGGVIKTKTTMNTVRNILLSRLSVAANSWAMVDTDVARIWIGINEYGIILYDDVNAVKTGRLLKRFELAHMTPLTKRTLPDSTQVQVNETKVFQLFPHKLGLAKNMSINNPADEKTIDKFNYPFLHEEPCR